MKFKNNIFLLSLTAVFLVGPQGWGMKQTDDKMVEVKCPFFLNPNNLKLYVLQINQKDLPNYKFTPINDSYYVLIKLNDDQTIPKISPLGKANFYYVDNNEIPLTQGLFCWYNKIHYKASHPDKRFDETPNPKIVHPSKSLYGTIKPPEEQSPPSSPKQKNLSPKIPETNIFKNTIQKLKNTLASLAEKIRGGEGGKKKKEEEQEVVVKGEREPVYVAILKDSLFEFATKTNSVAVFTAEKNEFYNVYHYFIIDEQRNKHNSIISDNIQNQLKTASKQNIKTIIFDSNVFFNSSNIDVTWLKDNLIKHFKTNQTSPIKNILFFTSFNYAQVCQDFNANNESFKKILFSFFIKNNPVKKILEIFKETSSFISNISNYELYKLDIQNQ